MTATRCAVDLSERNKVHRTDSGAVAVHQTGLCGWAVTAPATASNCTKRCTQQPGLSGGFHQNQWHLRATTDVLYDRINRLGMVKTHNAHIWYCKLHLAQFAHSLHTHCQHLKPWYANWREKKWQAALSSAILLEPVLVVVCPLHVRCGALSDTHSLQHCHCHQNSLPYIAPYLVVTELALHAACHLRSRNVTLFWLTLRLDCIQLLLLVNKKW